MKQLDFVELHKEKLELIEDCLKNVCDLNEKNTQVSPRLFKKMCEDEILDYDLKMNILNKNTKFVSKEMKKDFAQLRKQQKQKYAELRKQKTEEYKRQKEQEKNTQNPKDERKPFWVLRVLFKKIKK